MRVKSKSALAGRTSQIHNRVPLPVEEEQDGEQGLVDVAVAYALVEQEAGVPHHRVQRVLPHDAVELVCVEVLVHQLVPELAEVADDGAGGAAYRSAAAAAGPVTPGPAGHGLVAAAGQVQAAAAAVQADGRAAILVRHGCLRKGWGGLSWR